MLEANQYCLEGNFSQHFVKDLGSWDAWLAIRQLQLMSTRAPKTDKLGQTSSAISYSVKGSFHWMVVPVTEAFLVTTLMLREPPRSSTADTRLSDNSGLILLEFFAALKHL